MIIMNYHKGLFPFQQRWLEIGNHRIHYVDAGNGPTILFSHAALGSSFMFRHFITSLSAHYRCIALDYPGFGLSTDKKGEKYSIATQRDILEQFIHQLNLTHIMGMGHDTGGATLCGVAAKIPERFTGLILADTLIFPTSDYPRINRMLKIVGSRPFELFNAWTNLLVQLTFRIGVPSRKLSRTELEQYLSLYASQHKRKRITQILSSLRMEEPHMKQIKDALSHELSEVPYLLIYGEKDPLTQMRVPQRIQSMVREGELHLIPGAGHFPLEGQPQLMCEIIQLWASGRQTFQHMEHMKVNHNGKRTH